MQVLRASLAARGLQSLGLSYHVASCFVDRSMATGDGCAPR